MASAIAASAPLSTSGEARSVQAARSASADAWRVLCSCHSVPFPLLAHQAPILPLKARWPSAFNGTALVVGSIAPDLEIVWAPSRSANLGHTFVGQLTFCLPITLGVVLLVGHLRLGDVLAARLGKRAAWLAGAATDVAKPGGFERATIGALIGSFSHVAFDELTHETIPARLPHALYRVGPISFSMLAVTQAVASVIGALFALWVLRRIYLQNTESAPERRSGGFWLVPFAIAGAAFGLARSVPAIRHPNAFFEAGPIYVWGYVAFLVVCGAVAGVLVAAMLLAGADFLAKSRRARVIAPDEAPDEERTTATSGAERATPVG